MKTNLKIAILFVALATTTACTAQRKAARHMRKAVELCPELVQVKVHPVDTVLTVKPWADCTTVPLPAVLKGDTVYTATDHGTVVVNFNAEDSTLRVGFISAPQQLHYRDTLHYAQVVVPETMALTGDRSAWVNILLWLFGVSVGMALAVWLLRNAMKRN